MSAREKIAAKIRALLAKTVENGCTEDEAISAAAKAAEILDQHNLTLDEVTLRETPFDGHKATFEGAVGERIWKPAAAISDLTGATYWKSVAGVRPVSIDFFGFAHEVKIASYLLSICASAMSAEEGRLRRTSILPAHRLRALIAAHIDGMADRLFERIVALKPKEPKGTGLVVLRGALIKEALKDRGTKLRDSKPRPSRRNEESYQAGRRAAESIALNPALGERRSDDILRLSDHPAHQMGE